MLVSIISSQSSGLAVQGVSAPLARPALLIRMETPATNEAFCFRAASHS